MKKLIAVTAIMSGFLLLLVPRYILPACEYLGHPKMHCSDTAHAEYVVGALFIVLGGATAYLRSRKADLICAAGSIVLSVAAFLLPDKFGYCHNTQMPCNYGMVPGVRFVAVVSAIIMSIALIGLMKSFRKKGNS
jgi:hypothetical protein